MYVQQLYNLSNCAVLSTVAWYTWVRGYEYSCFASCSSLQATPMNYMGI